MINEMISEKQNLLEEIKSLRQDYSKSESNVTISRLRVTVALLHNFMNKAKDQITTYMPYMQKYTAAAETIKQHKSNIDKLNDESHAKLAMISQLNKKVKDADKDHDTTKKKSKTDLESKNTEIKEIKEELTRLNCEKGMISVSLKSKDDSLKKTNDEMTKLKDEIQNLKSKLEQAVNQSNNDISNSNNQEISPSPSKPSLNMQ